MSFALIIQHLQTKKSVQRQSLRTAFLSHRDMNHINRGHSMCRGESGVLCFVLLAYYITLPPACQVLFFFFSIFFRFASQESFPVSCTTCLSMEKPPKIAPVFEKIFSWYVFYKKKCPFSSQLNIYKSHRMRYNIYAVGNRRQVPFVAHCKARFCGMSISWHQHARRHDRCAILF